MAKKDGFTVCPNLAGHGIGSMFHGPPEILHTGKLGTVFALQSVDLPMML